MAVEAGTDQEWRTVGPVAATQEVELGYNDMLLLVVEIVDAIGLKVESGLEPEKSAH